MLPVRLLKEKAHHHLEISLSVSVFVNLEGKQLMPHREYEDWLVS
jgi:hypothetical protein